ncbi:MAG: hypothetical protein A2Z51_02740 [Deltaproteobacteria bacterium RBG_19FT_COMBO_52_11]|jgi:hypothetical protein|nr:MAG: hypothetical protein A2Z51_02740 [Deltaproteobacteria bacterium RBG_19FT_COMBO_52_11]
MRFIEYLIGIASDGLPTQKGFQSQPLYIFLNIAIPVLIGLLMGWIIKLVEKFLVIKKRRGN